MPGTNLHLYVTGVTTTRSQRAIASARKLAATGEGCSLEITDVAADPQAAERARVVATPTLDLNTPVATRRVVGDLADIVAVAEELGIRLGTHGARESDGDPWTPASSGYVRHDSEGPAADRLRS